jgi:cbb3-type cytochrome oxidase subunit 3
MEYFNDVVLWLRLHSILAMIVVFALIVINAYRPGQRAALEQDGMIPFREDR